MPRRCCIRWLMRLQIVLRLEYVLLEERSGFPLAPYG